MSIYSRLTAGYLVIFVLVLAVSIFAFWQVHQFNTVTRHILNVDNQIIEVEKKLSDSFLAQVRFERKFVITKDRVLHDQFVSAKDDFLRFLNDLTLLADTPQKQNVLKAITDSFGNYQSLINKEMELVNAKQPYPQQLYEAEKEGIVDTILGQLEMLETASKEDTYDQVRLLRKSGASARNLTLIMAGVVLILILAISFILTRSITTPLALLRAKTKEVGEGVFDINLPLSAPAEISELARAFGSMCTKLREVDTMKSDFFSMMSHELRTPLTSIKEGTALLREKIAGPITAKQERLLNIITEETRRLIEMVNSLLDLSKMEAGMMLYRIEKSSLRPLIERSLMEIGPIVESKGIRIETDIADEVPQVKMDSERILQVLRNLFGNAVKFTPEGGKIRVSVKPVGGGAEVAVADTGPGIPSDRMSTIFEKFQQISSAGPHHVKGTGLGLAIAKHIVASHGGKIWVESEFGKGSSFMFVLPS
jgi:two-component system sensor histidine kinase GlrK